ncbi:hypothetical protein HU200_038985 [Digitaria exilis]|uniref:Dynein light chain n=1 Tax=Digitaria exilis TaxID=1010633 RepID=A0A835BC28_9POAL|nr:hypothetical protein HU200_038985 [Digitaria exilis]
MAPSRLHNKPSQASAVLSSGLTTTRPTPSSSTPPAEAPHARATHWRQGRDEPAASQSNQQPCPPAAAAAAGEARWARPSFRETPPSPAATAGMDPASEELERRSRYLSSLIRRTKLSTAPAPAPAPALPPLPEPEEPKAAAAPNPEPEPEAAVVRREREEAKPAPVAEAEEKEKREVKGEEGVKGDGKGKEIKAKDSGGLKEESGKKVSVRVRAADMPLPLQRRAIRLAYEAIAAMPRLDSKRLALALKKEFDTAYGPAWHCIVGTSFGSYVTHSLGGFLYFSVDKAYILLFRTAVEPLGHPQ